jgi:hypothetical protein
VDGRSRQSRLAGVDRERPGPDRVPRRDLVPGQCVAQQHPGTERAPGLAECRGAGATPRPDRRALHGAHRGPPYRLRPAALRPLRHGRRGCTGWRGRARPVRVWHRRHTRDRGRRYGCARTGRGARLVGHRDGSRAGDPERKPRTLPWLARALSRAGTERRREAGRHLGRPRDGELCGHDSRRRRGDGAASIRR